MLYLLFQYNIVSLSQWEEQMAEKIWNSISSSIQYASSYIISIFQTETEILECDKVQPILSNEPTQTPSEKTLYQLIIDVNDNGLRHRLTTR